MDIVMTGDGQVLVSHDPFFSEDICLDPNGKEITERNNLFKMNYSEIREYDCGSKHHPRFPEQEKRKTSKPLLSEVIKESIKRDPNIKFNIEIKSYAEWYGVYQPSSIDDYVDHVLDCLHSLPYSQYNLQSFDTAILLSIANRYPEVRCAYLIEEQVLDSNSAKKLGIPLYAISPDYTLLSEELVKEYQKQGLKVIPWTVNKKEDMIRLADWG